MNLRHPSSERTESTQGPSRGPDVQLVILGGGFAGVSAAQRLEQLLRRRRDIRVVLLSQSNYLLFTPLLAEVAGGELEAQHIGVPLRAALPHTDVRRAEVSAIDTRQKLVWIRSTIAAPLEAVRYDQLVLALGSVPDYRNLSGLEAHNFAFKTLDDAVRVIRKGAWPGAAAGLLSGMLFAPASAMVRLPGWPAPFGAHLSGTAAVLLSLVTSLHYLFPDDVGRVSDEGLAARGLALIGRGALSGMVGGLLFTVVMLRINDLPAVARLVGASSPWTWFSVHLVIDEIIGASYGLLFARRSHDLGSAVGWGVSYGFFWWVLGALTLEPIMLGTVPRWTASAAAALLPSLVGHLTYGAGLGVTFHLLEAHHSPWWIPRTEMEEIVAARRKEQVLTSAPALWALVVMVALVLPILLA